MADRLSVSFSSGDTCPARFTFGDPIVGEYAYTISTLYGDTIPAASDWAAAYHQWRERLHREGIEPDQPV